MEYIFKKVKIIDPQGRNHHKVCDVYVRDGMIIEIKSTIKTTRKVKELDVKGSCLSKGWVDLGCHFGEPGNENRETLKSLSDCAIRGGYTSLLPFGNTKPSIHSKSEIEFIKSKSERLAVKIFPVGNITKEGKGEEMAEILQMAEAGAKAFSDGNRSIENSGLMMRALQYAKLLPTALLIHFALDKKLCPSGQMHEGIMSTYLGLRGIPSLAEHLCVHQDIELLEYTKSKLFLHKISTAESVQFVKKAKKDNLSAYCSVSAFNLVFDDNDLENFNVQLKLMPPLRSKSDKKALIKGLEEGVIDIICSDHSPWDPEQKDLEFQQSVFGSINLETTFSLIQSFIPGEIPIDLWVEKVSGSPDRIFQLERPDIEEGQTAELTWFHPDLAWDYNTSYSISKNSPLLGKKLKGKILGTIGKNKVNLNS